MPMKLINLTLQNVKYTKQLKPLAVLLLLSVPAVYVPAPKNLDVSPAANKTLWN